MKILERIYLRDSQLWLRSSTFLHDTCHMGGHDYTCFAGKGSRGCQGAWETKAFTALFWQISDILFTVTGQTFIIVLGDLYLLKIQCVHPVSFIVTWRSDKPYIFTAHIFSDHILW